MMVEEAVQIENLGKKYQLGKKSSGTLRGDLARIFQKSAKRDEFWALRDLSFTIKQGESIGIIGKNGAGKSTLLKIISRITEPTTGQVIINGRVSSLLEVGTGFHPELTGQENVYLNGTILGMTRLEIKSKFDEIVDFSGIEKFINTPVKHYSSGMKVRLAFSVAAHLQPEVLLIDEVLAVGDADFQKKCLGKMEAAATDGRTVVFVSHNLGAVRSFCKRSLLLENGELKFFGDTEEAINTYINQGSTEEDLSLIRTRRGDGELVFEGLEWVDYNNNELGSIHSGQDVRIRIKYSSKESLVDVVVRLQVVSSEGYILFTCNNFHSGENFSLKKGVGYFTCDIPRLPLNSGRYVINLQCLSQRSVKDEIEHVAVFNVDAGNFFSTGKLPSVKQGILVNHQWSHYE